MLTADGLLFDFSDSDWHFWLDGAIAMSPRVPTFNADPNSLPGS
jgi:hypothetical protein